jgi:crossover junction endodeoxyribonuclease RusA
MPLPNTLHDKEDLRLWITGVPATQGSHRAFVNKKTNRAIVVADNDAKQKTWRGDIREQACKEWDRPAMAGPVSVHLYFAMPRPKSTPKKLLNPPAAKRPDLDKLVRAVFDAISSANVWKDDSQVTVLRAEKNIAEPDGSPGCLIRIWDMSNR